MAVSLCPAREVLRRRRGVHVRAERQRARVGGDAPRRAGRELGRVEPRTRALRHPGGTQMERDHLLQRYPRARRLRPAHDRHHGPKHRHERNPTHGPPPSPEIAHVEKRPGVSYCTPHMSTGDVWRRIVGTWRCAWQNGCVHVIAVVNRKGGVGKTTTAVNLAAALALDSRRALLVDLDPQGSAGVAVGVTASPGDGSSGMLRSKPRWRARQSPVPSLKRLGVVPADDRLVEEASMSADHRHGERLAAALVRRGSGVGCGRRRHATRPRRPRWVSVVGGGRGGDPGRGRLPRDPALQGTIESVRSIERDTGRRYAPLVLLPTFVDARRPGAVDATALMRERFGDLVSPAQIPRSSRYDSSAMAGDPVVVGAPHSAAADAYRARATTSLPGWGARRASATER